MGNVALSIFTIKNILYHFDIIKNRKRINENIIFRDLNKEIVFEYINLDNKIKRLAEFRIQGFPKFLFFKHESNSQRNNLKIEINNTELNKLSGDISHNRIKN